MSNACGFEGVDDINVSADPQPFQNLIIAGLLMAINISIRFYLFIKLYYILYIKINDMF